MGWNIEATIEGYNLVVTTRDDVERLYLPGPYSSMSQIKSRNDDAGNHFFDRDTLRFFRSRVSDELYAGRMFVTSEQHTSSYGNSPRLYTVRAARDDGTICDVSGFQAFETLKQAKGLARKLERMVSHG